MITTFKAGLITNHKIYVKETSCCDLDLERIKEHLTECYLILCSILAYASINALELCCISIDNDNQKLHYYCYRSHNKRTFIHCDAPDTPKQPHVDVIKWKHFPRYWPFVRGIHQSPVNSPHKGQWRGALVFTLICARINGWVNNHEAGDLRRHRAHYDVTVMENQQFYCLLRSRTLHTVSVQRCNLY